MLEYEYFYYLIITYCIYINFSILIIIFGNVFVCFIKKRSNRDWNLSKLETIIVSYAIGISLYIMVAYILDIFQLFNFYFAYLPIIIIDIIHIINLYKKRSTIVNFNSIKNSITLNKKDLIYFSVLIIGIIFLQIFRFWPKLIINSSLASQDPWAWTSGTFYLLDHNHLNRNWFGYWYPPGFNFFCSGNLLITDSKYIAYFFMKLGSMPFLSSYIIVMYSISKRIFKSYSLIFFSLITILSFEFFLYRALPFNPSLIAGLLILISLIIIYSNIPNYLIGLIFGPVYLIHNLSGFYFIIILFIFYTIKVITSFRNSKVIFKEIIMILIGMLISLTPYFIHMLVVWNGDIIGLIQYYIFRNIISFSIISTSIEANTLNLLTFSNIIGDFLILIEFEKLVELFEKTIGFFLIFSILALVIRYKGKNEHFNDFYNLLKSGMILILGLFYFSFLFRLEFIYTDDFYSLLIYRCLETFAPFIILLAGIALEQIFRISNKFIDNLNLKHEKIDFSKITKYSLIFLLYSSSFMYYIGRDSFYYSYHYNFLSENILFIHENIDIGANITVQDFVYDDNIYTRNIAYRLLYDYNLIYYNSSESLTFDNFYNFSVNHNVQYLLIKRDCFSYENFWEEFDNSSSFIKIYQPNIYVPNEKVYRLYIFNE